MTAKAIGITDAEMRVYIEYKNSLEGILQKVNDISEALTEYEGTIRIKSTDTIHLSNGRPDRYFRDRNLLELSLKDNSIELQNKLISIYRTRKNYCERIEEILRTLDQESMELLSYRYFDNLTLEEIADKTFYSVQGVNNKLNKMLKFQLS